MQLSQKLNHVLLKEIDEVITQTSNNNEPLAYVENNSNSEFVALQVMHGCSREDDGIIHELLQDIIDRELMLTRDVFV